MFRRLHRFGWSTTHCGVALAIVLATSIAQAQTSSVWVDRTDEEGGWKDVATGLVWVDYRLLSDSWWSWETARDQAANLVRMGYDDWRLPTVNELQDASRKEIYKHAPTIDDFKSETEVTPETEVTAISGYWYWSSEYTRKKGGQAKAVRVMNSIQQTQLWTSGFATSVFVVRQGVPEVQP